MRVGRGCGCVSTPVMPVGVNAGKRAVRRRAVGRMVMQLSALSGEGGGDDVVGSLGLGDEVEVSW